MPERVLQVLREHKPMQKPGKASAMLLAAVVSFDIMFEVVSNPFFAFAGGSNEQVNATYRSLRSSRTARTGPALRYYAN